MKETKVFYTNGLMRMRMTQACDKMVISTMNSYMMIIHDLNLQTLAQDLKDFKVRGSRILPCVISPSCSTDMLSHFSPTCTG